MSTKEISIREYKKSDSSELLILLLELQSGYFSEIATKQHQELKAEKDRKNSYAKYVDLINTDKNDEWKVFLALTAENKMIGFIIGSLSSDEDFVKSKIGNLEDWFVEPEYRGKGIGTMLYNEIENWFRQKGCEQIWSSTWEENKLSIGAHKRLGFFVTEISFGKELK